MRKTLLYVVCLALVAATVCLAAQPKPQPQPKADWWGRAPGKRGPVRPPAQQTLAVGTVADVNASKIDVQTAQGVRKSFAVGLRTKVVVRGAKATIADVKVSDPVRVAFRLVNNVATAARIVVPKPSVAGKITAIDDNVITLKGKKGEFKVTVSEATKIRTHGYEAVLADLQVGYGAAAQGNISGSDVAADAVEFVPALARGAVTAVDGNTITVKAIRQQIIVALASAKTVVQIRPRVGPNMKGSLADVKVGAPVNIGFKPTKDGPSPLYWIEVLTGM